MAEGSVPDNQVWWRDTPVWRELRRVVERHHIRLINASQATKAVDGSHCCTIDVEEWGQPDEQLRVRFNGDADDPARQIARQLGILLP